MTAKIEKIIGREIIDSRGNPTVEAEVILTDGSVGIGRAPSGASTGKFEAMEKRDKDPKRYLGRGVTQAAENVSGTINKLLKGACPFDIHEIDRKMIEEDGTEDKSKLGANAILAVSVAAARSAAASHKIPLFKFMGGQQAVTLPVPMMNILNGGAHASNNMDIQEFMILPVGAATFREGLRHCCEVYSCLKGILTQRGLSTAVGDEGGFAPDLDSDRVALELILEAVDRAGYEAGKDFVLALDAAASEWVVDTPAAHNTKEGAEQYLLPKSGERMSSKELGMKWLELTRDYPIVSIEDPLGEEDWEGWQHLSSAMENSIRLVGDDLFVTNKQRLNKGIYLGAGNSILIKPNQIGTLSETLSAVRIARSNSYSAIMSHRSGETEDSTIADLAVALNTGLIKTGAPCRSERTAKYNRLLKIEELLGQAACYPGRHILNTI